MERCDDKSAFAMLATQRRQHETNAKRLAFLGHYKEASRALRQANIARNLMLVIQGRIERSVRHEAPEATQDAR